MAAISNTAVATGFSERSDKEFTEVNIICAKKIVPNETYKRKTQYRNLGSFCIRVQINKERHKNLQRKYLSTTYSADNTIR